MKNDKVKSYNPHIPHRPTYHITGVDAKGKRFRRIVVKSWTEAESFDHYRSTIWIAYSDGSRKKVKEFWP
jgi:hypothetical protein